MKVALLVTCLVDGMFPQVGKATVSLLERLGLEVDVPLAQTCCGQMHTNTGYGSKALPLVHRYVDVFSSYQAICLSIQLRGFLRRPSAPAPRARCGLPGRGG